MIDLKKILENKDTLNLEDNQKRLILLAMIKSDFKISKAYKLNCSKFGFYTANGYAKLYKRIFLMKATELRKQFMKQFGYKEVKGKLVKR